MSSPSRSSSPTCLPNPGTTQNEIDDIEVIQSGITSPQPAMLRNEYAKLAKPPTALFTPNHGDNVTGPSFTFPTRPPTYTTSQNSESGTAITTAAVELVPSSAGCAELAGSSTGVGSSSDSTVVAEDLGLGEPIRHPSTATPCSIFLSATPGKILHKVSFSRDRSYTGNTSDQQLLLEFRRVAVEELKLSPPGLFSLRKLKNIHVVEYSNPVSPFPWRRCGDAAARERELLCAYARPDRISTDMYWIDWIYQLNESQQENVGLEFVQGWDVRKIVVVAMVPWVASLMTAIAWILRYRDVQAAMAVATYILALSGVLLTLLGIIGTLEA